MGTKSISAQEKYDVKLFQPISGISIRALQVTENAVWFSGTNGVFGYTENNGETWTIDSIKVDSSGHDFRSIAVLNDSTVFLLSIGSPAYMFKTSDKAKHWKLVYNNYHKDIFFDCITFSDSLNGIALADLIDGFFQLIQTTDGGETWERLTPEVIPQALEGEGGIASSNSILKFNNNEIWFATGGKHSRIFYSDDAGKNFIANETPIASGEALTGIFSFDMYNNNKMVITGGNYEKSDSTIISFAISNDMGKTFTPVKTPVPFFGSCVKYFKKQNNTPGIIITGHHGTFLYNMENVTFTKLTSPDGGELKYHTISMEPSDKNETTKYIWLAGSDGKIARLLWRY
jgi:photosystem II stability/assembly factor-like uncharacterized protein